jgi:hypothetical protein
MESKPLLNATSSWLPLSRFAGFATFHTAYLFFAGLLQFRFLLAKVAF